MPEKTDKLNGMTERSNLFYMANLGSEFLRVFSAYEKKDMKATQSAAERCLSITDTLLKNKKSIGEEKEILMLKNIVSGFLNNEPFIIKRSEIESYFNPFAVRMVSGNF